PPLLGRLTRTRREGRPSRAPSASRIARAAPAVARALALDAIDGVPGDLFLALPFARFQALPGRRDERTGGDVLAADQLIGIGHGFRRGCTRELGRGAGRELPVDEPVLGGADRASFRVPDRLDARHKRHDLAGLGVEGLEAAALREVAGVDRTGWLHRPPQG